MLILSRVCAEFHNSKGEKIFAVTPLTRNTFVDAPEAIREDPLFRMLVNDGSMEAGITDAKKRTLENDPTAGHDAAGKAIRPEKAETVEKPEKSGKSESKDSVTK